MKRPIVRVLVLFGIILLIWTFYPLFKPSPSTLEGLMDSYANPGSNLKIGSPFSGTVLVAKNGMVVFHEAYGESNIKKESLNTINTKFGVGSLTKQFTAMLVMQLVEKNQFQLNDTISKFLPYLPKEIGDNITVHQLLANTSGLSHYDGLEAIGVDYEKFTNTQYSPKSLAQLIGKTKLINTLDKTYHYSSLGYDLLGVILEEVSGKSYAELLNTAIVQPLGLKNTGFADNTFVAQKLAQGYRYKEAYGLEALLSKNGGKLTKAPFRDQSTAYAAGGIYSTTMDLFIWSEAVKSHKLLSQELTQKMLTPNKDGYCYGWQRNWSELVENNSKVQLFSHGGALSGNSAYIALYDDETTIIYLANVDRIKSDRVIHSIYLLTNNLKDEHRLKGYPNWSSYSNFREEGGMSALNDYFNRLSMLCGYKVNPSYSSMRGIMSMYLEEERFDVADSLKNIFITSHNPNETMLNDIGYYFLDSDTPEFALSFFEKNTQKHPYSSNTWDSLGEAYLTNNEYKKAIECYTKAIEVGKKIKHKSLKSYQDNLKTALDMSKN